MAKRFTDTDKWKKKWFRELGSKLRDIRQFILDDCDHAGIWEIDLDRVKYHTGQKITMKDLNEAFKGELSIHNNKLIIEPFVAFQYGELRENNNTHRSVSKLLDKIKISTPGQPLPSPWSGDQDKDKDKDKDFRKESVRENPLDFESLYAMYPRKLGKKAGLKVCKSTIKTPDALLEAHKAVERYVAFIRSEKKEPRFIMHFSTFMNSWEDWLDPSTGSAQNFSGASGLSLTERLKLKQEKETGAT